MIPKIIWQTYKDSFIKLPQYAKDAAQTWKDLNPEYKYMYMNDEECQSFILREFGEEWLNIFNNYPLGVMRGDLWRYMVIFIYGGVYSDLDTICNKPVDSWINTGKDMVICVDTDPNYYAQLAFAAKPNHPTLRMVLNLIKEISLTKPYPSQEYVHKLTGVHIWTKAVEIGMQNNHSIYCYQNKNAKLFHEDAIYHITASKNWPEDTYIQWQKEILKIGNINDS